MELKVDDGGYPQRPRRLRVSQPRLAVILRWGSPSRLSFLRLNRVFAGFPRPAQWRPSRFWLSPSRYAVFRFEWSCPSIFSPPLMVRRISGAGFELDQNKVELRSPSALQGRIYYYLWYKCFSCLIRIDSVRFSCFCYVNNNLQNLIFSREIILVFSPSPSLRLPQISSGPMANPSVHNTIYQYPSMQPQMITYPKKVHLKRSYISIIPQK